MLVYAKTLVYDAEIWMHLALDGNKRRSASSSNLYSTALL